MVIAFGAFQEAGQSLRFAHPMFSLRRSRVNANVETKHICETNRLISWPLGQVVKTSPFHGGNMGSNPVGVTTSWGYSSAGRARALQARGHRFEPCCPHHIKKRATLCVVLFLCVGKQHRARIRRFLRLCANPCAPVPRSHCTLASKCKHFRFAVDEPCCPRVVCFAFEIALLK